MLPGFRVTRNSYMPYNTVRNCSNWLNQATYLNYPCQASCQLSKVQSSWGRASSGAVEAEFPCYPIPFRKEGAKEEEFEADMAVLVKTDHRNDGTTQPPLQQLPFETRTKNAGRVVESCMGFRF